MYDEEKELICILDELGLTKGQVDWQVEKIRRAKK